MELIKVTKECHEKLRAEMSELYGDGEKLSDQLINGANIRAVRNGTVTVVTNPFQRAAFEVEAALYLAQLAAQRNQKREEEAKRILDRLNAAGQDHSTNIHEPVDKPDPVPDPDPQPNPRQPHKPWRPSNGAGGGATIPSATGGGHSSPTGPDSGGHSWIRPSGGHFPCTGTPSPPVRTPPTGPPGVGTSSLSSRSSSPWGANLDYSLARGTLIR